MQMLLNNIYHKICWLILTRQIVQCKGLCTQVSNLYFQENYTPSISTLLLDSGAQIGSHDSNGLTPLDHLTTHPAKLNVMKYTSLKCLAVKVLVENNASLDLGDAPEHCIEFYREQLW